MKEGRGLFTTRKGLTMKEGWSMKEGRSTTKEGLTTKKVVDYKRGVNYKRGVYLNVFNLNFTIKSIPHPSTPPSPIFFRQVPNHNHNGEAREGGGGVNLIRLYSLLYNQKISLTFASIIILLNKLSLKFLNPKSTNLNERSRMWKEVKGGKRKGRKVKDAQLQGK